MPRLRAAVILAAFLIVTFLLIPVQWLGLTLHLPYARRFPHAYHRFVARLFGLHIKVVGTPVPGALIIANHTSWFDIVIFSTVMPDKVWLSIFRMSFTLELIEYSL